MALLHTPKSDSFALTHLWQVCTLSDQGYPPILGVTQGISLLPDPLPAIHWIRPLPSTDVVRSISGLPSSIWWIMYRCFRYRLYAENAMFVRCSISRTTSSWFFAFWLKRVTLFRLFSITTSQPTIHFHLPWHLSLAADWIKVPGSPRCLVSFTPHTVWLCAACHNRDTGNESCNVIPNIIHYTALHVARRLYYCTSWSLKHPCIFAGMHSLQHQLYKWVTFFELCNSLLR